MEEPTSDGATDRTAKYERRGKRNNPDLAAPSLARIGYSPSVSSWLLPDESAASSEKSKGWGEDPTSSRKFYDEIDNFVLEEDTQDTKTSAAEPSPSLDLNQLHAQSTASLVDEVMMESKIPTEKPTSSYLDEFVFEEDNSEEVENSTTQTTTVADPGSDLVILPDVSPVRSAPLAEPSPSKAETRDPPVADKKEVSPLPVPVEREMPDTVLSDKTNIIPPLPFSSVPKRIAKRKRSLPTASHPTEDTKNEEDGLEELKRFIENKENTSG